MYQLLNTSPVILSLVYNNAILVRHEPQGAYHSCSNYSENVKEWHSMPISCFAAITQSSLAHTTAVLSKNHGYSYFMPWEWKFKTTRKWNFTVLSCKRVMLYTWLMMLYLYINLSIVFWVDMHKICTWIYVCKQQCNTSLDVSQTLYAGYSQYNWVAHIRTYHKSVCYIQLYITY